MLTSFWLCLFIINETANNYQIYRKQVRNKCVKDKQKIRSLKRLKKYADMEK